MFGFIAEALYFAVDALYQRLLEMLNEHWENTGPSLNHGQLAIYFMYLEYTIRDWLEQANLDWPYADADFYAESCYSCYDGDVMYRAFSESIDAPLDKMWDIIYQAQGLYQLAQMFEALDGVGSLS